MANSEEVSDSYVATSYDDFMDKMRLLGYGARVDASEHIPMRIVISEDDYYHVSILATEVIRAPFNYLLRHIEKKIEGLKQ